MSINKSQIKTDYAKMIFLCSLVRWIEDNYSFEINTEVKLEFTEKISRDNLEVNEDIILKCIREDKTIPVDYSFYCSLKVNLPFLSLLRSDRYFFCYFILNFRGQHHANYIDYHFAQSYGGTQIELQWGDILQHAGDNQKDYLHYSLSDRNIFIGRFDLNKKYYFDEEYLKEWADLIILMFVRQLQKCISQIN